MEKSIPPQMDLKYSKNFILATQVVVNVSKAFIIG